MPLGKRNCSTLIIWRFMGTAMATPMTARNTFQPSSVQKPICRPVIMSMAAMAEAMVPPTEKPAALAVDCMQLFSRMLKSLRTTPGNATRKPRQME